MCQTNSEIILSLLNDAINIICAAEVVKFFLSVGKNY